MQKINTKVLLSGAEYFSAHYPINSYMHADNPAQPLKAIAEHHAIEESLRKANIEIMKVPAPPDCQDGVYTANWALIRGNKAILSNLPNKRKAEEPYAENILRDLGYDVVKLPEDIHFSGQGDALPCGNYLFIGTHYRTNPEAHQIIADELGFEVIGLQTIPELDDNKQPVINQVTGWPDSFFYDLDLAIAIIKAPSQETCSHGNHTSSESAFSQRETQQGVPKYGDASITDEKRASAEEASGVDDSVDKQTTRRCGCRGLIAWCPEAFMPESQEKIRSLTDIEKIEVSLEEAMQASACNLVSTGESVIMGSRAPKLQKALEERGLRVFTPDVTELMKGGGFIRCTSLTLHNS